MGCDRLGEPPRNRVEEPLVILDITKVVTHEETCE